MERAAAVFPFPGYGKREQARVQMGGARLNDSASGSRTTLPGFWNPLTSLNLRHKKT